MQTFKIYTLLTEQRAAEVRVAQSLLKDLSQEAQQAIKNWETVNWVTGDLSSAYSKKIEIYHEIENAAESIRKVIRKREGNKITLYRGIISEHIDSKQHSERQLYSWTSRPKVAALFANIGYTWDSDKIRGPKIPSEEFADISIRDANKAQKDFDKNGIAHIGKFIVTKIREYPDSEYGNVFIKDKRGIKIYSFGSIKLDDIANWFISKNKEYLKAKAEIDNRGFVVSQDIPVDNIVWVLRDKAAGGTMEYIVRGYSGISANKIKI